MQMRTRFCETILREGGFAKPRLIFLKFGGIGISAPQEGAGGMRGGVWNFWRAGLKRKTFELSLLCSFEEK
jgi:hypothetical protein